MPPIEVHKLDEGIKPIVLVLRENDVETFESCEGGKGHCFPEPTVRFRGDKEEGLRVALIAIKNDLPIFEVRRSITVLNGEIQTPFWEATFKVAETKFQVSLNPESGLFTG